MNAAIGRVSVPQAAATVTAMVVTVVVRATATVMAAARAMAMVTVTAAAATAMATAAVMAGGDGNDDSCRDGGGEGNGGMLALSVLPLLRTNKIKKIPTFKPITSSPCEDAFFGEQTCDGKGFRSNQQILSFC
jgi:hypothetical protein